MVICEMRFLRRSIAAQIGYATATSEALWELGRMGALGNEQWQEQKQDPIVTSDEGNANEGSEPTRPKPAIAPPRGGSTEEEQGLPPASSMEGVELVHGRWYGPWTALNLRMWENFAFRHHMVWLMWDNLPHVDFWQLVDAPWNDKLNHLKAAETASSPGWKVL